MKRPARGGLSRHPKVPACVASRPRRWRIALHALAATQHYAEPQKGSAKNGKAGRLRSGCGYVENNAVSADSVERATRAEREGGNAIHKALSDGCSAQTSRTEGHAGNHFAIGRREGAEIERERATRSVASKEAKIDVIQRRRHRCKTKGAGNARIRGAGNGGGPTQKPGLAGSVWAPVAPNGLIWTPPVTDVLKL